MKAKQGRGFLQSFPIQVHESEARKGVLTRFPNPFCDFHSNLSSPMNIRAVIQGQKLHVVDLAICVDDLLVLGYGLLS